MGSLGCAGVWLAIAGVVRLPCLGLLTAIAFVAACDEPEDDAELGGFADGEAASGKADGAPAGRTVVLRDLEHAAFPGTGRVDAVVYVPADYDPSAGPTDVVVFLHGHHNCVENVIRRGNGRCRPGGAPRQAYDLAAQLEASGRRAILLVPELAFDAASSAPGALGEPDGFEALLTEVGARLEPTLGAPLSSWGDVVVVAHSGGYRTASRIARVGGYPVRQLYLLDSLYDAVADFAAWIDEDLESFAPDASWRRRFASVYTGGTPQTFSRALATSLAPRVASGVLLDDRTTRTWSDADHARGLMFKRSGLGHDAVVRWYFGRLLAASELPLH